MTGICPLCESRGPEFQTAQAVISPWLRELAKVSRRTSKLYVCPNCQGGFFDYRYSDKEMNSIYSNYRGTSYTNLRSNWEPWYSESYNSAHNEGTFVDERKAILKDFLLSSKISEVETIVDIGGDLGQYIPTFNEKTKKYLLDLSSRELVSDVSRISSFDELASVDLIIYAHVLEHVPLPLRELELLLGKARYIYVEVPYGVPILSRQRRSRLFFFLTVLTSLNKRWWGRYSHPSAGRGSKTSILRQSEHINFFNLTTVNRLAIAINAQVVSKVTTIPTPDKVQAKVLQILFSRQPIYE